MLGNCIQKQFSTNPFVSLVHIHLCSGPFPGNCLWWHVDLIHWAPGPLTRPSPPPGKGRTCPPAGLRFPPTMSARTRSLLGALGGRLGHALVADLAFSQWAGCRKGSASKVPERKECGLTRIVFRNYDLVHVKPRCIGFPLSFSAFDESFTS